MDISVVMPSYLGYYKGCASDRDKKIIRAIKSFINQNTSGFTSELIIVSDGCDKTNDIYQRLYKDIPNVRLVKSDKCVNFSGIVRQKGISEALGEYICFLDIDDYLTQSHLYSIVQQLDGSDWYYWDDYIPGDGKNPYIVRPTELQKGKCGTSTIAYKKALNVSWESKDGYGHDFEFITDLIQYSNKFKKIYNTGYICCHIPGYIDL